MTNDHAVLLFVAFCDGNTVAKMVFRGSRNDCETHSNAMMDNPIEYTDTRQAIEGWTTVQPYAEWASYGATPCLVLSNKTPSTTMVK